MANFIIMTDEQLEARDDRLIQKFINLQQPPKEETFQNIGSEEARRIVSQILGHDISKSKWTKDSMNSRIPNKGKAGKWIIYDRTEIIQYAESIIRKPMDLVSDAVEKSARRRA